MLCDNETCKADFDEEFCIEKVEFVGPNVYISGHCNLCSTFHQFHWWEGENMINLCPLR